MKNFTLFVFTLFVFTAISCQDESENIVQDTSNNFTKASPIASLIRRVSQYETTADNVLDGTSNCSIKLPAHVTVNNQYVYVIDESYFTVVQNIKDQSNSDDDKVHFSFPVTIVYPNYYEYTVNSESQFNTILAGYGDDSSFHKVSCVNFNYPISINLYNTNSQVASTVTVQSDTQFYNFIYDLNESQIVGIVFPITLTNSSAQQITITSNDDLETVINDAISNCSTSPTPTSLSDVLILGSWHISYYYHENHDETTQFSGYNFTFNTGGTSIAVKNTVTINGNWDVHNDIPQRLDLHFDGSQLDEIESNWTVLENTSTYVRLKHQESGGSGTEECSYLYFTKNQ